MIGGAILGYGLWAADTAQTIEADSRRICDDIVDRGVSYEEAYEILKQDFVLPEHYVGKTEFGEIVFLRQLPKGFRLYSRVLSGQIEFESKIAVRYHIEVN
jgi:hypothetical protein